MDNRFNEVFPSFDPFNKEFALGSYIFDTFPSCFSFHPFNKQRNESLKTHICHLNNISIIFSSDSSYTLVVTNASIKNNVATSVAHIHVYDKPVIKTIHYTVNVTSIEAKLFVIRYSIH